MRDFNRIQRRSKVLAARVKSRSVVIKTVTWAKDSHGLFDYETRSIEVHKFKAKFPIKLVRQCKKDKIASW
jgi:hypothetical protein